MLGLHRTPKTAYTLSASSSAIQPLPTPMVKALLDSYDSHDFNHSADCLTAWLNGRWKKSGYQVSKETVAFTLRLHGRNARIGAVDNLNGVFYREIVNC